MSSLAVLRGVDAVTVPVPDLDQGLRFYRDQLGHELVWRNDAEGQVGLRLPESQAELVLSTNLEYAVNWLVTSVSEAVEIIVEAGGKVILEPTQIPVGRLAVVNDPFGNTLVLLDLSAGRYVTDVDGRVLGVQPPQLTSSNRHDSQNGGPSLHRLAIQRSYWTTAFASRRFSATAVEGVEHTIDRFRRRHRTANRRRSRKGPGAPRPLRR